MTWDAHHRRGDVLRTVVDEVNLRRDGSLPMELPGVTETFADDLDLVAALQLRWHTRLAGRVERALVDRPADLERAVVDAWRAAAADLPGVRAVLDAHTAHPTGPEMADALERAHRKDLVLMAAMAGKASVQDVEAVTAGAELEKQARAGSPPIRPATPPAGSRRADTSGSLLGRIKAVLAA